MKAQVFLLTAAIVIAVLVGVKGYMTASKIASEREILDISLEGFIFKNIDGEVKQVIRISQDKPGNITNNAVDYLNFTRSVSNSRSLDIEVLFVGANINSTNQTMNITAVNFLRKTNLNVTIILNTSSQQSNSTSLNDTGLFHSNFTYTKGDTYNLTIWLPDENYRRDIIFKTRGNKDSYAGFFDLGLVSERATYKDEIQQKVDLP
ncbi:MAG: hypothetical protein HYW24_01260 [Candidatus Aenigmarchaeota archaeon]|nr:hypothetical protein [Candidatus Aenigmarchaeota archaeon]